jgi:hypothetical protein
LLFAVIAAAVIAAAAATAALCTAETHVFHDGARSQRDRQTDRQTDRLMDYTLCMYVVAANGGLSTGAKSREREKEKERGGCVVCCRLLFLVVPSVIV